MCIFHIAYTTTACITVLGLCICKCFYYCTSMGRSVLFGQVISLCEKPRDAPLKYVIVDTPGQIEIFTWSASGAIITEAFASGFPTMVAFVIDTPRCAHPQTFMSNMLQVSF